MDDFAALACKAKLGVENYKYKQVTETYIRLWNIFCMAGKINNLYFSHHVKILHGHMPCSLKLARWKLEMQNHFTDWIHDTEMIINQTLKPRLGKHH